MSFILDNVGGMTFYSHGFLSIDSCLVGLNNFWCAVTLEDGQRDGCSTVSVSALLWSES